MTSPSIGIRIVNAGNNSVPGHMYVVLNDGSGNVTTYGYYPNVSFPSGVFGGPGEVRENFDRREHEFITDSPSLNTGAPNVKYDIPLTNQQFDAAKRYAIDAVAQAGKLGADWGSYSPLRNSCIDFTWRMMREAGLNPAGKEGALLPSSNTPRVDKAYFDYYRRPEFNKEFLRAAISPAIGTTPDPLVKISK